MGDEMKCRNAELRVLWDSYVNTEPGRNCYNEIAISVKQMA